MIKIRPIQKTSEIETVASMAKIVFHEVYDPYTPVEFVEKFIQTNQSLSAIENQIQNENYHYYFLLENNQLTGYLGLQLMETKMTISKFYILKEYRGKGIGKHSLKFINDLAQKNSIKTLQLQVSEHNHQAIKIYEQNGYHIESTNINTNVDGTEVKDYLMIKELNF